MHTDPVKNEPLPVLVNEVTIASSTDVCRSDSVSQDAETLTYNQTRGRTLVTFRWNATDNKGGDAVDANVKAYELLKKESDGNAETIKILDASKHLYQLTSKSCNVYSYPAIWTALTGLVAASKVFRLGTRELIHVHNHLLAFGHWCLISNCRHTTFQDARECVPSTLAYAVALRYVSGDETVQTSVASLLPELICSKEKYMSSICLPTASVVEMLRHLCGKTFIKSRVDVAMSTLFTIVVRIYGVENLMGGADALQKVLTSYGMKDIPNLTSDKILAYIALVCIDETGKGKLRVTYRGCVRLNAKSHLIGRYC